MTDEPRYPQINMSAIRVAGIGGLGMVVMAAAVAAQLPFVRWIVIGGAAAGAVFASAIIFVRRRQRPDTSADPFAGKL
jgi:hypothetical protein